MDSGGRSRHASMPREEIRLRIARASRAVVCAVALLWVTPASAVGTGDCDGNGVVTIDELVKGVNIALGSLPIGDCVAADENGDGEVEINELVASVNNALNGITVSPTPSQPAGETPTVTTESTRTRTATATVAAEATATATSVPATATSTPTQTATSSHTPSITASATASPTVTAPSPTVSSSPTPSASASATSTDSVTPGTPTASPTGSVPTATASPSHTPTATASASTTATRTGTPTQTGTRTATQTRTVTQSASPTLSRTATSTRTSSNTATQTRTATATRTITSTPTVTATASVTRTVTATRTPTPTGSATATVTAPPSATISVPTPTATEGFQILDLGSPVNQVGDPVPVCFELLVNDIESMTIDFCVSDAVFEVAGIECFGNSPAVDCSFANPSAVVVSTTSHFPTCELDDGLDPHGQAQVTAASATPGTGMPLGIVLGCKVGVRTDAVPGQYPLDLIFTASLVGGGSLSGQGSATVTVAPLDFGDDCLSDPQCGSSICRGGHCCLCECSGTCDDSGDCSPTPCAP